VTPRYSNQKYLQMLRAGRGLGSDSDGRPVVRVAILADHSTQQMTVVLKAALMELGFQALVLEADFSTAAQEVFDRQSGLYAFKPDYAFFSLAVQKFRDRFLQEVDPKRVAELAPAYLAETTAMVDAVSEAGVQVILSNLALPIERMFGNYSALTPHSLYGSVLAFNRLLAEAVSGRKRCQLNDVMYLSSRVGAEAFLDERLWLSSKYLCANQFLPEVARSVARLIAAGKGKVTKCLVLDLDNTLWGGVIGDDGLDGIVLGGDAAGEGYQLFQRYIKALKHRGYVLAVCSKNNEETALSVFRTHPEMILREEDIAIFIANWNDKASNIEFIARALNLGLDSLVFIDDSPFERDLVRTALPSVAVPELPEDVADYVACLEGSGLLEATVYSEADHDRNRMYREEARRTTEQIKYSTIDDYLKSLGMSIECGPFTAEQLPRIAQLIQRSNQFNLRTQRLSEGDCERYMRDPAAHVTIQARLRDRFGDYGLIAVVCCDVVSDELFVTELLMSCRVLKRGVEEYLMNRIFAECSRRGLRAVRGEYIKSGKNSMVEGFFRAFGYDLLESDELKQVWRLPVERYEPRVTHIGADPA
jgi:FkbH-like protein